MLTSRPLFSGTRRHQIIGDKTRAGRKARAVSQRLHKCTDRSICMRSRQSIRYIVPYLSRRSRLGIRDRQHPGTLVPSPPALHPSDTGRWRSPTSVICLYFHKLGPCGIRLIDSGLEHRASGSSPVAQRSILAAHHRLPM